MKSKEEIKYRLSMLEEVYDRRLCHRSSASQRAIDGAWILALGWVLEDGGSR